MPKQSFHFKPGTKLCVMTVTHYWSGVLVSVDAHEIHLKDVSWIADAGLHREFIAGKPARESEAHPAGESVLVGRNAVVAIFALP